MTTASGYRLYVGPGESDALEFEQLLAEARQARGATDWATVLHHTTAAKRLWRGRPLTGIRADQLQAAVQRLVEGYRDVLEWHFDAALRTDRTDGLPTQINAAIEEFPLAEVFHIQLMRTLLHTGRHADALNAYQRLRRTLAEELGIDPSAEAQQVHQLALEGAPEPAAPASGRRPRADRMPVPSGTAPRTTPDRVRPAQLPPDIHDFTGRVEELRLLLSELGPGKLRRSATVCAITGPGGMGKTTLAVHAAYLAADAFPDGTLYADLRGADRTALEPAEVLAGFLHDLGTEQHDIPRTLDGRSALLRSLLADRRVLILLDNARDAAQVRPLLPGAGPSAAIVTGRSKLASLAVNHRAELGVLAPSDARALLASVAGRERTDGDPEATRAVVESCAGLPLAVRIAAARLATRPAWTMTMLAARLTDRTRQLDELRIEDLAVRACFEMSYAQLSKASGGTEGAARAFRFLGLAPGRDIALRAAAAMLGQPLDLAEDQLEQLVDVCLLDSPAPARYRMHDLIRSYARDKALTVDSGPTRQEAVGRVSRWYLHSVREADSTLFPGHPRPQAPKPDPHYLPHEFTTRKQALAWFAAEHANLIPATGLAAEHGFHDVAWRIPGHAWAYLNHTCSLDDWLTAAELGLRSARIIGDEHAESTLLSSGGAACVLLGNVEQADKYLNAALDLRRRIGDRSGQVASLATLGVLFTNQGQYGQARDHLLQALGLATTRELRKSRGSVLGHLAVVEQGLGLFDEALRSNRECASLAREFQDHQSEAGALTQIGIIEITNRRPEQALEPLREALATSRHAAGDLYEAHASAALAIALDQLGRTGEAEKARARALDLISTLHPTATARIRKSLPGPLTTPD